MAIKVGDRLPDANFKVLGDDGPADRTVAEVFDGKTVALFAVPGAYTPTCQQQHLPSFLDNLDALKAKGVDTVACVAVNDVFVLKHWAADTGATGKIVFLSDGNADFTRKIGLDFDGSVVGLGIRSKRYAMLVEDRLVKVLNVEEVPSVAEISRAENLLSAL